MARLRPSQHQVEPPVFEPAVFGSDGFHPIALPAVVGLVAKYVTVIRQQPMA